MKDSEEYQNWICYRCNDICSCFRCCKNPALNSISPTILIEQVSMKRKYRKKKKKFQLKQTPNNNPKKTYKKRKPEQIIQITNLTVINNFEIIELMSNQKDLNSNNSDVNNNEYLNSNDYYCYNKQLYAKIISNCENKFNILTNNTIGICDICKNEFYCGNELLVFDSPKVLNEYIEGVLNYKKDIVLFDSTDTKVCSIDKVEINFSSRKIVCKVCFLKIINMKGFMNVFKHFLHENQHTKINKELVNNNTCNIKQIINSSIVNQSVITDKNNNNINHGNYSSKIMSSNSKEMHHYQKRNSSTKNTNKNDNNLNVHNVNNNNKTQNVFNSVFSNNSPRLTNISPSYRDSSLNMKTKNEQHNKDKQNNINNNILSNNNNKIVLPKESITPLNEHSLNSKGMFNKNTQLMNYVLEMLHGLHNELTDILKRLITQINGFSLLNKDKLQEEISNLNRLNTDYMNVKNRYNQISTSLEQLIQKLVINCRDYIPLNEKNFELLKEELRIQVISYSEKKQQFEQYYEYLGLMLRNLHLLYLLFS